MADADKSAALLDGIAKISNEQASGVSQVTQALAQVEKAAVFSKELASQVELLKNMVGKFQLNKKR